MADLDRLIRVDLLGTVAYSRAFLPQLITCGHGQLVTVSSAFGLTAVPGYAAYAAAKFGIPGFTKAVQQELHPANVAVSAVYPRRHPNQHHATRHLRELRRPRGDPAPIRQLHRTNLSRHRRYPHPARGRTPGAPHRIGPDAWLVDALVSVAGSRHQRFSRRMGMRQDPDGGDRDGQPVALR